MSTPELMTTSAPIAQERDTSWSMAGSIGIAEAQWTYESNEPSELSFKAGDRISVIRRHNDDWWYGEILDKDGKPVELNNTHISGDFPSNYVKLEEQVEKKDEMIPNVKKEVELIKTKAMPFIGENEKEHQKRSDPIRKKMKNVKVLQNEVGTANEKKDQLLGKSKLQKIQQEWRDLHDPNTSVWGRGRARIKKNRLERSNEAKNIPVDVVYHNQEYQLEFPHLYARHSKYMYFFELSEWRAWKEPDLDDNSCHGSRPSSKGGRLSKEVGVKRGCHFCPCIEFRPHPVIQSKPGKTTLCGNCGHKHPPEDSDLHYYHWEQIRKALGFGQKGPRFAGLSLGQMLSHVRRMKKMAKLKQRAIDATQKTFTAVKVTRRMKAYSGTTMPLHVRARFYRSKTKEQRHADVKLAKRYSRSKRVFGGTKMSLMSQIVRSKARDTLDNLVDRDEFGRTRIVSKKLKQKGLDRSIADNAAAALNNATMKIVNKFGKKENKKQVNARLVNTFSKNMLKNRSVSQTKSGILLINDKDSDDNKGKTRYHRRRNNPDEPRPKTVQDLLPRFYKKGTDNGMGPKNEHEIIRRARKVAMQYGSDVSYILLKEALIDQYGDRPFEKYKRRIIRVMQENGVKVRVRLKKRSKA